MTDTPRYKALQILRIRMAAPRAWRGHVEVFVTPRVTNLEAGGAEGPARPRGGFCDPALLIFVLGAHPTDLQCVRIVPYM